MPPFSVIDNPSNGCLTSKRHRVRARSSSIVSKVRAHDRFLQGSDEALRDAVALGLSHEGRRSFDTQAFDLVLEVTGHVVGAMIVTQHQSTRHTSCDGSEAPMRDLR
jgi:hypothetical protein